MTPIELALIAMAGGVGAIVRFLSGAAWPEHPMRSTTVVNLVASLLAGLFSSLLIGPEWHAILVAGFCGGMSTYSAFAVQTVAEGSRGRMLGALGNAGVTLIGGAIAAGIGLWLGAMISPSAPA